MNEAKQNTDRELWRATPGDYYSPSIHVTQSGRIGISVGGHVIEKPLAGWHSDACAIPHADPRELLIAIVAAVRIEGSQKKAAAKFGISPQYLNDVLKGNREIPDKVARHFGVRRVVRYESLGDEQCDRCGAWIRTDEVIKSKDETERLCGNCGGPE